MVIAFIILQIWAMSSQTDIETYKYKVIETYDGFEVRQYEPALFTSVQITAEGYREASGKGFRVLAGYIFGGNDRGEKIAMTSPVSMSMEETMTMMFMVPSKYKKEELPIPNDGSIEVREVPARKMAAITFGGWSNDDKIVMHKAKLLQLLDKEGINYTDKWYFYGYNSPYEVVNRRNEVVVELE